MTVTPRLDALTGLRYVAALWVFLYHLGNYIEVPLLNHYMIKIGHAGVSLFFILSGFVMTLNYGNKFQAVFTRNSVTEFYWMRAARIMPMYWFALIVMTFMSVVFRAGRQVEAEFAWAGPVDYLGSWIANATLTNVFIPNIIYQQGWNPPGWSVGAEAFFYLMFPFLLCFVQWVFRRSLSPLGLLGLILLLQILSYTASIYFIYCLNITSSTALPSWAIIDFVIYRQPFLRIWEFCFGIGLFYFMQENSINENSRSLVFICGIFLLVFAATIFHSENPFSGFAYFWYMNGFKYVFFTLPFILMIASIASGKSFISRILGNRVLVEMGEASYSLYILQSVSFIVLIFLKEAGLKMGYRELTVTVMVMTAVSLIARRYVEIPAGNYFKTLRNRHEV